MIHKNGVLIKFERKGDYRGHYEKNSYTIDDIST